MTQIFVKSILHLCIFRQLQMTKNRTPTLVYLDPGMHPVLEVKGLSHRKQKLKWPLDAPEKCMIAHDFSQKY